MYDVYGHRHLLIFFFIPLKQCSVKKNETSAHVEGDRNASVHHYGGLIIKMLQHQTLELRY